MGTGVAGDRCDVFHLGHFDFVGLWGSQMKIQKSRAQTTGLDGG